MKCDTERENDNTDNTLGLKLGNMCVYKISEKQVSKSRGATDRGRKGGSKHQAGRRGGHTLELGFRYIV